MAARKKAPSKVTRTLNSVADYTKVKAVLYGAKNVKREMTYTRNPGLKAAHAAQKTKGMMTMNQATGKALGQKAAKTGTKIMDQLSKHKGSMPKGVQQNIAQTKVGDAIWKGPSIKPAADKIVNKAAKNYAKKYAAKAVVGRVVGRAVPIIGTALLAKDVVDYGKHVVKRAKSGADNASEKAARKAASKNSGGGRKIGGRR